MTTWAKTAERITLQELLLAVIWPNLKMVVLGGIIVFSRDIVPFLPWLSYRMIRTWLKLSNFVENKLSIPV